MLTDALEKNIASKGFKDTAETILVNEDLKKEILKTLLLFFESPTEVEELSETVTQVTKSNSVCPPSLYFPPSKAHEVFVVTNHLLCHSVLAPVLNTEHLGTSSTLPPCS